MASSAAGSQPLGDPHALGGAAVGVPEALAARRLASGAWWLLLVTGILWVVASLVILQFDQASVTTVGVIIGCLFAVAALQQLLYAALVDHARWLWALFGVLFAAAAVVAFISPQDTFAALADVSGFLFLIVGVWWIVRAFLDRPANATWWLGLTAGILMVVLAFWTSGQFFIERAYTLLVFAGIWALMQGIVHICAAFAVKSVRDDLR